MPEIGNDADTIEVPMLSTSTIRSLPTSVLLSLLLGNRIANRLAKHSLQDVFSLSSSSAHALHENTADYRAIQILDASKELMSRALAESMRVGDCLNNHAAIKDYLRLQLAGLPHEVFMVLLLDSQHRLIDSVELFRGTISQTSVYPREVIKLALQRNASSVVFAHNHPSGIAEPSSADKVLTQALKQALALVDVSVLDHFVVAGTDMPLSFAELSLI
jgi:DNA repair protein RadC